ncbi:MAG: hypothetical protein RIE86_09260 [Imperialibacter sp.]|uniref:hypothetical protein n=1 Tax=Imperialibacter sp. TaxID=2038411 RepID=UPI0032EC6EFE
MKNYLITYRMLSIRMPQQAFIIKILATSSTDLKATFSKFLPMARIVHYTTI